MCLRLSDYQNVRHASLIKHTWHFTGFHSVRQHYTLSWRVRQWDGGLRCMWDCTYTSTIFLPWWSVLVIPLHHSWHSHTALSDFTIKHSHTSVESSHCPYICAFRVELQVKEKKLLASESNFLILDVSLLVHQVLPMAAWCLFRPHQNLCNGPI